VREGRDLQVVDAQSGEDLTRVTLTQIIMDDAKQQPTGLPVELLRQLIVSSDRMGREFIMWYLKSAYDAYQSVQSKLQSGLTGVQSAAFSPLNMMKSFLQTQSPAPPSQQTPSDAGEELRQLRERLAEIESRVKNPAAHKPPAKHKPAKKAAKKTVKKRS
jgi:polyhydroxyalkanoate synthesis regulator protein